MAKKKKCVIPVKNRDDLCCARAIVTMKEQADNGIMEKSPPRVSLSRKTGQAAAPRGGGC